MTFNLSSGGGGGEVPEPTSMAIFGLGAFGLAYRNRRKQKA
ncbi:MAG: PEP-CTERM sorting domain-containing protein [Planctomycetaceae bacterium]|nr:PEP-CTERM sorting domain-containing protein [Planctomycetaceae bacterium]